MKVSSPHICTFLVNGQLPHHITTVEGPLNLLQLEGNAYMQRLDELNIFILSISLISWRCN